MRPAALLLAALCACGPGAGTVERPRNVVLFMVDTLRASRLSCYGYERPTSPTLDRMAELGTLYERNYAQGYWTVPSMISAMSGLYVTEPETALPPGHPTLAETLSEAGVTTAAFVGNRVLTLDRGFQRGFDHFQGPDPNGRAERLAIEFGQWYAANRAALERGRGFFAWIHPMDPHDPYRPKPRFRVFEGPRPGEAELHEVWRRQQAYLEEIDPEGEHPSFEEAAAGLREETNLYDGEVLAVDYGLNVLLGLLQQVGELSRTLVIFAADHGETHAQHPEYPQLVEARRKPDVGLRRGLRDVLLTGHRGFRDDVWRTPLVLWGPGVPAGARRTELTANLDLYPTILDAFDVPAPAHLAGRSLWGPDAHGGHERVFGHSFDTNAVVDARGLKVIEHTHERFLHEPEGPRPLEAFRPLADPAEREEVSDELSAEAERLRETLHAWRAEHARTDVVTETSEAAREALIDLGYVDE